MARKPTLDSIKMAQICAILAVGGSRHVAASYIGCSLETIRRTAERNPSFHEELLQAEARHEIQSLQRIQDAAKKETHWRAASWTLERHYPDRYGSRKPQSLTTSELAEFLERFAELVTSLVTDPAVCEQLLTQTSALTLELTAESRRGVKRRRRRHPTDQE